MRYVAPALFLLCCLCPPPARGGDADGAWSGLAGMREELEGQNLELRDELIPAHLSYLEALTRAAAEAGAMDPEAAGRALAWARVEYLLDAAYRLLESTGEYDAFLKATEPLRMAGGDAPAGVPLLRARAAWLRALALEDLGRTADASGEAAPLELIRDWAFFPLPDTANETRAADDPGLDDIRAALPAWRAFRSADPLGRIHPGALFPGEGRRIAAAAVLVEAPEAMGAVLRFGSNAPATVFLNGASNTLSRSAGQPDPDQEVFPVRLRKGGNILLVRTASDGGDWSLALRLTLPDGTPFPGKTVLPPADVLREFLDGGAADGADGGDGGEPAGAVRGDGLSALSRRLAEHPDDARANFYLASFLVARSMMEGPERFDRELIFRRALEGPRGDPFFTLMAARSIDSGMEGPDREENLRLVLLRRVADAGSAAALADMGRLYLDVMRQPRRAREYAERALSVNPMSLRAGVLEYDVAVAMDWLPVAERLLADLVGKHPEAASARLRMGRSALAGGRYRQALAEFHAVLAVRARDHEAIEGAVLSLGMLGQTSAAADLLAGHIGRFPCDLAMRLRLAELYRTLGRDEDARAALAALLAVSPDEPRALAMAGELDGRPPPDRRASLPESFVPQRQELDSTPLPVDPPEGWEYLYFQTADRLTKGGRFSRNVSFALRVHTLRAAKLLRHLSLWLEQSFSSGTIVRIELISPDGTRAPFTPGVVSAAGGEELKFHLPPLSPGMTVEAEVAMERERLPFFGEYFGHIAPLAQSAPVRLSRYMFVSPRERRVFFRPVGGAPEAMEVASEPASGEGGIVTRIWEMSDLPAFRDEPFSPGRDALSPCVQVSSFGSWDEFARWYWHLIGAQYHAPPELRLLARTLSGGGPEAGDPLAGLDRAAAWIAANIGHRAREYGPYAFRPINARSVLSRLSADGKDRTLLLCLLAREYGLEAWPVLSRLRGDGADGGAAGTEGLELPLLDHFNHSLALVRAPVGGDVLMDAANPYRPPGVMPSRLFGSPGIVVMPDGSAEITVPDGGVAACEWSETAELVVDEDGSVIWEEKLDCAGTAAQILRQRFARSSGAGGGAGAERDGRAWTAFLQSIGAVPSAVSDAFADAVNGPDSASWEGRARLRRFAGMEEGRAVLDVPPLPGSSAENAAVFPYPLSLAEVARTGERGQELLLPHAFRISRALAVRFPEEWTWVNREMPFRREYPFGTLTMECAEERGRLSFRMEVEIPGHRIPASEYGAFREMAALVGRWLSPRLVWEVR